MLRPPKLPRQESCSLADVDAEREAELRKQGWTQVGDDLLSPELIAELKRRAASDPADDLTLEEFMALDDIEDDLTRPATDSNTHESS